MLALVLFALYGAEPAWLRYELEKGLRAVYCYEARKPAFLVELFLKLYFTFNLSTKCQFLEISCS